MQGIKRQRRCEADCRQHIFSLHSLSNKGLSKYDIKLMLCPKYQRDPLPPEQNYPVYNNDNKFYTSAFILGVEKRALYKNDQQERMEHQRQVKESMEKKNQFCFPRPNSRHTLCSVCKEHYHNYYAHICSQEHRLKIKESLYNGHIYNLALLFEDLWKGSEEKADEEEEDLLMQDIGEPEQEGVSVAEESQHPPESIAEKPNIVEEKQKQNELKDNFEEGQIEEDRVKSQKTEKTVQEAPKRPPMVPFLPEQTKRKIVVVHENVPKYRPLEPTQPVKEFPREEPNRYNKQRYQLNMPNRQGYRSPERHDVSEVPTEQYTAVKPHGQYVWKREPKPIIPMPYQSWKRQDYYEHNYHDYNRAQMNQYPAYQQKYDKDGARDTKTYDNRDHLRNSYDKPYDNYEQYDKGHHKHEGHYDKPRDSHYDKDKKKQEKHEYKPPMYYPQLQPWQYSPYYMPHSMGHIGSNQSHLPPQDGKSHNYIPGSNTNININIPMYLPYPNSMYPLQSPRNYPMMPPPGSYMGYQYPPPYMPGQPMLPKKDFHK